MLQLCRVELVRPVQYIRTVFACRGKGPPDWRWRWSRVLDFEITEDARTKGNISGHHGNVLYVTVDGIPGLHYCIIR